MLIDSQTYDVVSVFQVEWLNSISCAQNNPRPGSMVHNVSLREVVQVVPGVESSIAVNEFQTEFLRRWKDRICVGTISKVVGANMGISGYHIYLISISASVSDRTTKISGLDIERE